VAAWTWPLGLVWLGYFLNEDLRHLAGALHVAGLVVLAGLLAAIVVAWQRTGRANRREF
jgi:membrane protein DedA with SNARE-associated domain